MQKEHVKLNLTDQIMIFITAVFMFIHVKQLLASGQAFMINAMLGIWISMSIFDMYGRWRRKRL